MRRLFYLMILLCYYLPGQTQSIVPLNHKYSIQFGYGIAGSFFVRSYFENELPFETSFFKKHFIGRNLNVGISRSIGQNFHVSLNYTLQEFNKRITYSNQFGSVVFQLGEHQIRHTNNMYDLTIRKQFDRRSYSWFAGVGLYYLRPIQQEIIIDQFTNATLIRIQDRRQKYHRLNELGTLVEAGFEKKFQPRMIIGLKSQIMYTLSTQEFESATLFPYLKYTF